MFDFRHIKRGEPSANSITLIGQDIDIVQNYKYLGTIIDNQLNWSNHCSALITKGCRLMYLLRKLNYFHVDKEIMILFYSSVIESAFTHECVVWYNGARKQDTGKMKQVVKQASKILGIDIDLDETCKDKVRSKAEAVECNTNHALNKVFIEPRSGRRWQSLRCKTNRFLNSFIPYSVRLLNLSV